MANKKPKPSAKQVSAKWRDWGKNLQKPAPFGRYEDYSPKPGPKRGKPKVVSPSRSPKSLMPKGDPTVSIAKKVITKKRAGSEGPKRSTPRKKK